MNAEILEQRIGALSHHSGCQFQPGGHGGGQQANPRGENNLASLPDSKAEPEHPTKVFDTDQIRRKNIRHTDRIDKVDTHEQHPQPRLTESTGCASLAGESTSSFYRSTGEGNQGLQFVKPAGEAK